MSHYIARLQAAITAKRTPAIVGLDPRFDQLPQPLQQKALRMDRSRTDAIAAVFEEFSCRVVDVVAPLIPAVKPQAAFFEECGPAGSQALARTIRHARNCGLLVICDAKRSDIGSTAEAYARGYLAGFDPEAAAWGADALTVNPYLGADTLEPFVQVAVERGAGLYVLVRTSNPGAGTFQDLQSASIPVFQHVAQVVEALAERTRGDQAYGAVGAVVGATYPRELSRLRALMPHTHFLVPGYGSQGAGAAEVAGAFDAAGRGAVINSSRAILFAHSRPPYAQRYAPEEWEQAVEQATHEMIADLGRVVSGG